MQPLIVTAAASRDGDSILITRRPRESRHGGVGGETWESRMMVFNHFCLARIGKPASCDTILKRLFYKIHLSGHPSALIHLLKTDIQQL